jgi:methyl-accepting chemotaxis protein
MTNALFQGRSSRLARLRRALSMRLSRVFSVHTRIVLIACIPIVGFIVNGVSFTAGEQGVSAAFDLYQHAVTTTDASQGFKDAINQMRLGVRDFVATPTNELIEDFGRANALAMTQLGAIEATADDNQRTRMSWLRERLGRLGNHFSTIVAEQTRLGFSENEGLRRNLRDAGHAVERAINDGLGIFSTASANALMTSLIIMRRFEAEQRIQTSSTSHAMFMAEFENFKKTIMGMENAGGRREELMSQVKVYADTFTAWSTSTDRLSGNLRVIEYDTQDMIPAADQIMQEASRGADRAASQLMNSQHRTKSLIVAVGCAAALLGLVLSFLIGRSITGPLHGLSDAMRRLAQGETSLRIPAVRASDEIGDMARTVIVFRDTMLERERLAQAQKETGRAREARSQTIATTIGAFEHSVNQLLLRMHGAAERLESASGRLDAAADGMSAQAHEGETRVLAASDNIASAAGSVEELAASIGEIAGQARKSTEVAARAVAESRRTTSTMQGLAQAATRIGEVVTLIQAVAGQTNLLALNATIEAARAGDAGRGFAVVAAEVKSLAAQTAHATEDIAGQIGAIQSAAADAARAIGQVNGIIAEMSDIAMGVAATVQQQNAAVTVIAEGVTSASGEARTGAEAMSRVAAATADARSTAADVRALADALAVEAERLDSQVRQFLIEVQAA